MRNLKLFSFLILFLLPSLSFAQTNNGDTLWAKSTTSASNNSYFRGATTDSNGNKYAVGYIRGTDPFDFGNGITVSGPYTGNNILLVKYDPNGNTLWAKSFLTGTNDSGLSSVATDSDGNIYVAGYIKGNSTFYLGGVTIAIGSSPSYYNIFVAKYDSSGNPLWARSTLSGPDRYAQANDIVVDSNNNLYVVGYINSTDSYDFYNGITAAGSSTGENILLIKYDTNGFPKWAKTVSGGNADSTLNSVTLDKYGNPHLGGYISGTAAFNFGNDITLTPPNPSYNILVAQYNSTGYAQWAKSATVSTGGGGIKGIALDDNGNIFASGYLNGYGGTFEFGNGVNATMQYSGANGFLIKYDSAGQAQWAKNPIVAPSDSEFIGVDTDYQGNAYVAGYIMGVVPFDFGNNITAQGNSSANPNLVLVNYDGKGDPILAKSLTEGASSSFVDLHTDRKIGDIYASGSVYKNGLFDLGNNITVNGSYASGYNPLIVKYRGIDIISESSSSSNSSASSSNSTTSSKHPTASSSSSSSSNNSPITSEASSIIYKLPKLFAIGGGILLLF